MLRQVFQFKITLARIEPAIWRRIQIREAATFWDLHVAIQDAFGWEDRHLHAFSLQRGKQPVQIGIPDPAGGRAPTLESWFAGLDLWMTIAKPAFRYVYDFGDDWLHDVVCEGLVPRQKGTRYPALLAGANAGPPEDVGGPPGYFEFLAALHNPAHERHAEMKAWIGGEFDPLRFDAAAVRFSDPRARLRKAGLGVG